MRARNDHPPPRYVPKYERNVMNWSNLKERVIQLLSERNLADPNIRLRALSRLEEILRLHFNDIYNNPSLLLQIEKNKFKEMVSFYKKLNSAESSIINNFYQILENNIPTGNDRNLNSINTKQKNRNNKPEIVSTCEELSNPIFGLKPIVDNNTKILILGTFPAKESIDADFYYQNQIKRFWGQALSYIGSFENISNKARRNLLLDKKIGLWDIFECIEREESNQDKAIKKAKYNNLEEFLNKNLSIRYLIFNGNNAYIWLYEDMPNIFKRSDIEFKRLQSSSGGNGHFNKGKDWEEYFKAINYLSSRGT